LQLWPESKDFHQGSESLRIGTSGYSFEDWRSVFYPQKLNKAKMLDFYVQYFNTVEINVTYYRIPAPKVFEGMIRRTGEDFRFMVKAHQSATHQRHQLREETSRFLEAIKPVADAGRLSGVLAQFPWSFQFSPENREHLKACAALFAGSSLFIEFRHASWLNQESITLLTELGLGYVIVDEPPLPGLVPDVVHITNGIGYYRLHGRNAAGWYHGGGERYNYNYSEVELTGIAEKIKHLRKSTEKIYVFFNNCFTGFAVMNARRLKEMLDA